MIRIKENIFKSNDGYAAEIRQQLDENHVFSINIMASPGAGKTSLIEHTITNLSKQHSIAVIDGDIATSIDADRASAAGAKAFQINTDGACHLDAKMISDKLVELDLKSVDFLIIENVGNLVCPASFKLGTHKNILIASIPEGDDKPYKYPGIYRGVDILIINKIDLLPYVPFNMDYFLTGIQALNPGVIIFKISCQTGDGLLNWFDWVDNQFSKNFVL